VRNKADVVLSNNFVKALEQLSKVRVFVWTEFGKSLHDTRLSQNGPCINREVNIRCMVVYFAALFSCICYNFLISILNVICWDVNDVLNLLQYICTKFVNAFMCASKSDFKTK
jgi:hypothetical protein